MPLTEEQMEAGRVARHEQQRREHELLVKKVAALEPLGLTRVQMAKELGVSRTTLYKVLAKL